MKVNMTLLGLDRTGGNVVLWRYAAALRDRGHQVGVTTLGRRGDSRFMDLPTEIDVHYVGLRSKPYKALVRLLPGQLGFPNREIARLRGSVPSADLQIATHSFTPYAVDDRGEPILYHIQHFEPLIVPHVARIRELARRSYLIPAYRTANCTWVADRVREVGSRVEAIVSPAVDHSVFTPKGTVFPSTGFRVLTLGKAVAWKGLRDVVAAVRDLGSDGPVTLVSYGPDRPRGNLGPAVLEHHGFVDQTTLATLYRSATVCVSASWYESFPLPPLEAMASGTPVICTRLGTEDYAVDGENALVVPDRNPGVLADAIRRIRDDAQLRERMIANGLEVAARFTWESSERVFVDHCERAATGYKS